MPGTIGKGHKRAPGVAGKERAQRAGSKAPAHDRVPPGRDRLACRRSRVWLTEMTTTAPAVAGRLSTMARLSAEVLVVAAEVVDACPPAGGLRQRKAPESVHWECTRARSSRPADRPGCAMWRLPLEVGRPARRRDPRRRAPCAGTAPRAARVKAPVVTTLCRPASAANAATSPASGSRRLGCRSPRLKAPPTPGGDGCRPRRALICGRPPGLARARRGSPCPSRCAGSRRGARHVSAARSPAARRVARARRSCV